MTFGVGAIGEYAIGEDSSVVSGGGGGVGAAAVWAYELLPGISAGEMLIACYEALLAGGGGTLTAQQVWEYANRTLIPRGGVTHLY